MTCVLQDSDLGIRKESAEERPFPFISKLHAQLMTHVLVFHLHTFSVVRCPVLHDCLEEVFSAAMISDYICFH